MRLDTIIRNARIHTMAADRAGGQPGDAPPAPEAVGIAGGRIVAFDDELEGSYASAGEVVDAAELTGSAGGGVRGGGRGSSGADGDDGAGVPTVVPGFIDAHCHTTWFGLTLASVDVENCPGGLDEVYDRLAAAAAQLPDGEWVQATGYSHHDYAGSYPDIAALDRITGGRPLFMRQVSGHSAIVNTAALRAAGMLEPGYTDPAGGKVVRDADGRPTGLVEETAQTQVQDLIRPYSVETIVNALDLATAYYAKEGITSFGEAGIAAGWIGHSPLEVFAYQQARQAGLLRARAQLMPVIDALHPVSGHAADSPELGLDLGMVTGFGDDEIRLGPVKIFMDGALSGRTAALNDPYVGQSDAGYLQEDPEVLRAQTLAAYRSGWSLAVHAIGDRAVDEAIANITAAVDECGKPAFPNRIEHAGMIRTEQLSVLAEYGIAVTPQAAFFDNIGDGMLAAIGTERAHLLYRGRSFLDAGVMLAGSSDRPCAEGNVLRGMQLFMTRLTRSGRLSGPGHERLSASEALAAYTSGAAAAMGMTGTHAGQVGRLVRGALADIVILTGDPLTTAPEAVTELDVQATMRGGQWTHR
ncbi:amidohydrolase [Brevibacterium luteolum]|uniref:amidohydrolase n=1 Tax=Brevibacterium luteolum TaxID=199591 RepID=UPI00223AA16E|nr:amidohydrolase [Brevibacterium luteolum]MCT1873619.1 amidohydrolase [Brevibacterium luteolum]MCT1889814.1 amidohydrolase [Brevibacterium luteolum]MCT1892419.1 amidohydrolase [Brevibacterium luteolum]MCT1923288.1 amidohydrolase [Brevibacterium luteolum]